MAWNKGRYNKKENFLKGKIREFQASVTLIEFGSTLKG